MNDEQNSGDVNGSETETKHKNKQKRVGKKGTAEKNKQKTVATPEREIRRRWSDCYRRRENKIHQRKEVDNEPDVNGRPPIRKR